MKYRKYDTRKLFVFLCVLLFFVEMIFIFIMFNQKIVLYEKLQGIVEEDNKLSFLVTEKELQYFYNNKAIYINDQKEKFFVVKINDVLEKDNVKYKSVLIQVKISSKYKLNDVVEISILSKKIRIIEMFKIIWEEE